MYLGLDVGGTHTDAVLIKDGQIIKAFKSATDHDNLIKSIIKTISGAVEGIDISEIKRINLSTTLSTNSIVENKLDPVCVIISSGPGIDANEYKIGDKFIILNGSIDHRGEEIKAIDGADLKSKLKKSKSNKFKYFAAVTKFSTRNSRQENFIASEVSDYSEFTTYGHKLSGRLNFPRRVATAYYNSAVWSVYNGFANAISNGISSLKINADINILKADGGTIPLEFSRDIPVETILSGPSASIMGILALCDISKDSIALDIGGTTTDIAIFVGGVPLIERDGVVWNGTPTLVRSLMTRSIGLGGDSFISIAKDKIKVGPERNGPSVAEGGKYVSLIDVMNFKGLAEHGDMKGSISAVKRLGEKFEMSPDDLAQRVLSYAISFIKEQVDDFIEELNNKPVYSIHDMLHIDIVKPVELFLVGGPAKAFESDLTKVFNMKVTIPENYMVANAVGAALAKVTSDIELFADTGKERLLIPNLDIDTTVASSYTLEKAEMDAVKYLSSDLKKKGVEIKEDDIEIIESSMFKMIDGYFGSGKDIRVRCQVRPGIEQKVNR